MNEHLNCLQRKYLWRPIPFDRVTVSGDGKPLFSIVGKCYAPIDYSGPSAMHLADVAQAEGFKCFVYGLHSCRKVPR